VRPFALAPTNTHGGATAATTRRSFARAVDLLCTQWQVKILREMNTLLLLMSAYHGTDYRGHRTGAW